MSKDMLGSLVRVLITVPEHRLGLVKDVALKLSNNNGDKWEQPIKRLLRKKEPCWTDGQVTQVAEPKPEPPLVEIIGTVTTAPTKKKFVVRGHFKLKRNSGIYSYIGDNLTTWFLSGDGLIEEPLAAQTLQYGKLRKAATDLPPQPGQQAIIPALGGETKVVTTMTEIHDRTSKQANGESGALLTNGSANIFYVLDQYGVLRAVYVVWLDDGWGVSAHSVESPLRWSDGGRVFSRNSVLESSETSVPAKA